MSNLVRTRRFWLRWRDGWQPLVDNARLPGLREIAKNGNHLSRSPKKIILVLVAKFEVGFSSPSAPRYRGVVGDVERLTALLHCLAGR